MMVWDPDIEKYLPFGNLKTHAIGNVVLTSQAE